MEWDGTKMALALPLLTDASMDLVRFLLPNLGGAVFLSFRLRCDMGCKSLGDTSY